MNRTPTNHAQVALPNDPPTPQFIDAVDADQETDRIETDPMYRDNEPGEEVNGNP